MEATPSPAPRLRVAGKRFWLGEEAQFLRVVTYGPFPHREGESPFPDRETLANDFRRLKRFGFQAVRLYDLPNEAVLGELEAQGIYFFLGIPWTWQVDYRREAHCFAEGERLLKETLEAMGGHPFLAGLLVANEIPAEMVRWMGRAWVADSLERLVGVAKAMLPDLPCGYATFPPTEFLCPRNADFYAANVYLEVMADWRAYLRRLHHFAGDRPLLLSEFGVDASTHGKIGQANLLSEAAFAAEEEGAAGFTVFSWSDAWHAPDGDGGDWAFGIVDAQGHEKLAAGALRATFEALGKQPALPQPKVSLIVCTRNGAPTLAACLESLRQQSYPDYEVIVVDDGSTDETSRILKGLRGIEVISQEPAGLSAARNEGAAAARGELLVYTDDDCVAPSFWLHELVSVLEREGAEVAGGPNVPFAPAAGLAGVVARAPGNPAHVLLDDVEAEHLPGCNLAVTKAAWGAIGGFDPQFRTAGDDVDFCWRLREAGYRLVFAGGAMVWHHRRGSLAGYLRQQIGYGRAEALLLAKHPERFRGGGGARWRGVVYEGLGRLGGRPGRLYQGVFATAGYPRLYGTSCAAPADWLGGVSVLALGLLASLASLLSIWFLVLAIPLWAAHAWPAFWQARSRVSVHEAGFRGRRWQVFLLTWLQGIARSAARLVGALAKGRLAPWEWPRVAWPQSLAPLPLLVGRVSFWNRSGVDRHAWLAAVLEELPGKGWQVEVDPGWQAWDLRLRARDPFQTEVMTATEYHPAGGRLLRIRLKLSLRVFCWALLVQLFALALGASLGLGSLLPLAGSMALSLGVLGAAWLRYRRLFYLVARLARQVGFH
ncbi:MAG: glycosyltransferase [Verrucomicrobiota bacterium]